VVFVFEVAIAGDGKSGSCVASFLEQLWMTSMFTLDNLQLDLTSSKKRSGLRL
jgi:hypothetical protein